MADFNQINQFGSAKPARSGDGTSCAQCEAMLPDWMDNATGGELSAPDRAAFELHLATCAECAQMLADAQRGAALLEMLKAPRPLPSAALLDRIIASTSGQSAPASGSAKSSAISVAATPSHQAGTLDLHRAFTPATASSNASLQPTGNVLPFRSQPFSAKTKVFNLRSIAHTMMQPRLAMTAAMAFFSIALTLNLTGVRLGQLRASDLAPSNIKHTLYQAEASGVRYYDNLRVVYELESRVRDLQHSSDSDNAPANAPANPDPSVKQTPAPAKSNPEGQPHKPAPKSGSGSSQQRSPLEQQLRLADFRFSTTQRQSIFTTFALDHSARPADKSTQGTQPGGLA